MPTRKQSHMTSTDQTHVDRDSLRQTVEAVKALLGPDGWSTDPDVVNPLLVDSRNLYHGKCALLARPKSVEEVASVVRICFENSVTIVPQGGNTGRVGAATPNSSGEQIILSLTRMNSIRAIDPADYSITVEAGCILQDLQNAAADADRLFPLSLGAEGSCTIGGNIASNAGGINVLRYGNTRDLVLGLEAVLPNGEIWNGLHSLRKNNTGYDLKHVLIGSEGTLGIITAATLKLFPKLHDHATALCALSSLESCLGLLELARSTSGDALISFELLAGITLETAYEHVPAAKRPMEDTAEWSILLEFAGSDPNGPMQTAMESMLETAFEEGLIVDAALAQSEQQRKDIWFLREAIVDAQNKAGPSIKHDISVPVSSIPDFLHKSAEALEAFMPGIRPYPFGHVGDGNLHYNITAPTGMGSASFERKAEALHRIVHDITADFGGSFSAEHGIGQTKRTEMQRYKAPLELTLMRKVKDAFDPSGIFNPGKVL